MYQPVDVGEGTLGWPGIGTVGIACFSTFGEAGSPGIGTLGSLFMRGDPIGDSTSAIVSSSGKLISKPVVNDLCLDLSSLLLGGLLGTIGVSLGFT